MVKDPAARKMLKNLRLDTEKWLGEMDKKIYGMHSFRVVFNTIPPGVPDFRDVIANYKTSAILKVKSMFPVPLKIIRVEQLDK